MAIRLYVTWFWASGRLQHRSFKTKAEMLAYRRFIQLCGVKLGAMEGVQ